MAVPFYEPKNESNDSELNVDQVDGLPTSSHGTTETDSDYGYDDVDYEAPTTHSATTQTNTEQSTADQLIAWKVLALAMCKALKEYYLQNGNSKNAFTNAVVQIQPNGKVEPKWK